MYWIYVSNRENCCSYLVILAAVSNTSDAGQKEDSAIF